MIKVKICGLSTPETLNTAIEAGADFVGLVFYPPSPRHVELDVAHYLANFVPDEVSTVGLFIDPDDKILEQMLDRVALNYIQLHGQETPERIKEIKQRFKLPIIKAVPIQSELDIALVPEYEEYADWILFDAKADLLPGGNGVPFDWNILSNYEGAKPWMLAGGLTPENVAEALKVTRPDAVDVSSGVESQAGIKAPSKIRAFISAVKQA